VLRLSIKQSLARGLRAAVQEVRTAIAALGPMRMGAAALKPRLVDIQDKLEGLGSRASGVGLKARDNIEGFSSGSDTLLSLSVATAVVMVGVALLLLERLISQARAARRDAEARDAEMIAAAREHSAVRERELAAKSMRGDHMSA